MIVSLVIWVLTGTLIGVGWAMAFKQSRLQYFGNAIIGIVCAVAGGWMLTKLHVEVGGPYIGAAVNAAIGSVVVPIVFLVTMLFN